MEEGARRWVIQEVVLTVYGNDLFDEYLVREAMADEEGPPIPVEEGFPEWFLES